MFTSIRVECTHTRRTPAHGHRNEFYDFILIELQGRWRCNSGVMIASTTWWVMAKIKIPLTCITHICQHDFVAPISIWCTDALAPRELTNKTIAIEINFILHLNQSPLMCLLWIGHVPLLPGAVSCQHDAQVLAASISMQLKLKNDPIEMAGTDFDIKW